MIFVSFRMQQDEPSSPAERLIDEGRLVLHGIRIGNAEVLRKLSPDRALLTILAAKAAYHYPALMFRAMVEGSEQLNINLGKSVEASR